MRIPLPLLTDSYKTTHTQLYPNAQKMVAYGEFRCAYEKDTQDARIVLYGLRYIVENHIAVKWTVEDVEIAADFFKTHNSPLNDDPKSREFPFPKDLFLEFINENDGYFPVKIEALPEGSVIYPHTPVYQITAEGKYSRLVTYLETILTMIWYPSTVATLSRRCKDIIERSYQKTVDDSAMFTLDSRLHDFGFRGCTSVEQSVIGGCSHLLNFTGSDTLSAAFYAQYHLNNKVAVGSSIPATEHSIMTAYKTEREAMAKLLELYGTGICACVMDSYDYTRALEEILPSIKSEKLSSGGLLVLRPDSGDPVEVVLQALRAAEKIFGATVNSKGYKIINGVSVIQGDGISHKTIGHILSAMEKEHYAAQNAAFGMGGGLLQKVNRDTMSFATKLSHITYEDGTKRDIMKMPKTDLKKFSLPGEFTIVKNETDATSVVYPKGTHHDAQNNMVTIYNSGKPVDWKWESFDQVRARLKKEWKASSGHLIFDPISQELKDKIQNVRAHQEEMNKGVAY